MAQNFKYDDYQEDFDIQNNSSVPIPKQNKQPETTKVLKTEQKRVTESQVTQTNDNSTKGKLIDQHVKLKSQLKQLAGKMDEILEKQRQRKKKKLQGQAQDEDQRVTQLKKKLKDQQIKIQKIKSDTTKLRRNMDSKYDMNKIVDKENELKHLKKQLQVLQQQKDALQKIRKTQDKAIRNQDDKESKNKKSRLEEDLKQVTNQTKKQLEVINQKQKQVRKLHQIYITKVERSKDIEAKINQKKKQSQQDQISTETIAILQEELKQIQSDKLRIQKEGNQKIKILQKERRQLKNQLDRKKLILDQKQKQLRLNQMKHKQIIRLINSSQQQQIINESRVEKQNKNESKRVVAKKGRDAPKMDIEVDQQAVQVKDQVPKLQNKLPPKPQKHEFGFTANLQDQDIIDDT